MRGRGILSSCVAPHTKRRTFLQTIGAASVTVIGGCIKAGGPEDSTSRTTQTKNTKKTAETATTVTGRTYQIIVQNAITKDALKADHNYNQIPPAKFKLKAYHNPEEGGDSVYFKKELAVPPSSTKVCRNVFSTEADGTEYVLKVNLTNLGKGSIPDRLEFTKYYRFIPGGFQWPTSDTLTVTVQNAPDSHPGIVPLLSVDSKSEQENPPLLYGTT